MLCLVHLDQQLGNPIDLRIELPKLGRRVRVAAYRARLFGIKARACRAQRKLKSEECVNGIRSCCICPGEVATPILDKRPVPVSDADKARMLQADDLGETILFVARMPPHVCLNEILISPTWNRSYAEGVKL